ncbi:MAG: T9SS type A sorting domain-containing protein, partial [Bacteroidales bacterium]|nr:T9SS type A sorting domain-containing protein [Bacteroidales bacterium]
IDGAIYYLEAFTGNYLSYNGGMGGGTNMVPPGQGFFVSAVAGGTFDVDESMRLHNGGSGAFYKNDFANMVVLEAEGNGLTDATYIRFETTANEGWDGNFDAYKLFTWFNDDLPQIYTIGEGINMSINVLPETEAIPVGFQSGVNGTFTINAVDVKDIGYLMLEDLFTGTQTNLLEEGYTFNYDVEDAGERFMLHFGPLAILEMDANAINIYSYGTDVYIYAPENTKGHITVFDMLGQEVTSEAVNTTLNKITLEKSAYYIVKVLSDNEVVTKKVFIE